MKKTKTKQKGVRYIANVLKKYLPGQYKTYSSAAPKAKEILAQLKSSNTKVKIDSVLPLARVSRQVKKEKPLIDPALLVESYYFQITQYPVYILRSSEKIFFKSNIFPKGLPEVQGGDVIEYTEYFQAYVNYINSLKAMTDPDQKMYETEWMVKATEPIYNRTKKRWESEIISLNGDGEKEDYGFDRKNPTKKPKDAILAQQKEKEGVKSPTKEDFSALEAKTGEFSRSKEILELEVKGKELDIEKERQKNISNALKLFGEGAISKQEFKELMAMIKR